MDHIEHLTSLYDVAGRTAADVGTGKGHFAKQLARCGAIVTGIEIEETKVAAANARMPEGSKVVQGRGEDLPLETASQDLVCFMYSFHHIPISVHEKALAEATRVLKPHGRLHFVEPMPESCASDPMKLIDDETHVRTCSHARIRALSTEDRFELLNTKQYQLSYAYEDFDSYISSIIGVDPERAAKLPAARDEMERLFYRYARFEDGKYGFDKPCTAYHFQMID